MLLPDCRQDEYYNYDFLSDADKEHVDGFDLCVEVMRNALQNAEDMDFEGLDVRPSDISAVAAAIGENLDRICEAERDELITGLIDDMDDDEFNRNRAAAIARNGREHYFDTQHFACTGKKIFHDEERTGDHRDSQG